MTRLRWSLAAGLLLSFALQTGCQRSTDTTVPPSPFVERHAGPAEREKVTASPASIEAPTSAATSEATSAVESPPASSSEEVGHRFEIRDQDGKPIVTDRQIVAYDWKTHRITLEPGTKMDPRLKEGQLLVSGIPFTIVADGVVCYAGVFTTSLSSASQSVPVINVHPLEREDGIVWIELGYPSEQFFRGVDPRGDKRIRSALDVLGKLKD